MTKQESQARLNLQDRKIRILQSNPVCEEENGVDMQEELEMKDPAALEGDFADERGNFAAPFLQSNTTPILSLEVNASPLYFFRNPPSSETV